MNKVIINDCNLKDSDIDKRNSKARAVLVDDGRILVANYGGVILLPGGSIDKGETDREAIIRELREETGILYGIDDLSELFTLDFYQAKYLTRDNECINRLITTYFYQARFKGLNPYGMKRTEKERKDNFYLELLGLRELFMRIKEESTNPRKYYFDREMEEVVKVLKKDRHFG